MKGKVRYFALAMVLMAVLGVNLVALTPLASADTGLPCYDKWRGCLDGGGGTNYCEGVWLGCMESTYPNAN